MRTVAFQFPSHQERVTDSEHGGPCGHAPAPARRARLMRRATGARGLARTNVDGPAGPAATIHPTRRVPTPAGARRGAIGPVVAAQSRRYSEQDRGVYRGLSALWPWRGERSTCPPT